MNAKDMAFGAGKVGVLAIVAALILTMGFFPVIIAFGWAFGWWSFEFTVIILLVGTVYMSGA